MDYEKKYNEALKWMRKLYPGLHGTTKEDAEHYFPELRESEDERIRKEIINYLDFAESHNLLRAADYEKKKGWLAYLEKQKDAFENGRQLGIMQEQARQELEGTDEKQKEQKPIPDWMPKFLDELRSKKNYFDWDEHRDLEGHILAIINWIAPDYFKRKEEQKPETFSEPYSPDDCGVVIEGNATSLKRKEQKPNYCHHEVDETGWTKEYRKAYYDGWNNCNMQHEQLKADQKPAEWSEEDEKMYTIMNSVIKSNIGDTSLSNYIDRENLFKLKSWLENRFKSLKPQPKQEWSEEDKNELAVIISVIEDDKAVAVKQYPKCKALHNAYDRMLRFLKSLSAKIK